MVSIEPSDDELAGFHSAEDVLRWCGFKATGDSTRDSFCAATDMEDDTPLRLVGAADGATFAQAIAL